MFELATSYATYMAIFLSIMAVVKYISYKYSIKDVHKAFQEFSEQHNGQLDKGSFLVPPSVSFKGSYISGSTNSADSEITVILRSFYLYRGRRGNYTELSFHLPKRNYLISFSLTLENPHEDEESRWIITITEPVPTAKNTYKKLITLLTGIGERFFANHLNCSFDGEKLSINVLELIDNNEDINEFLRLADAAFQNVLRITKS
jgi:hypothetical protein